MALLKGDFCYIVDWLVFKANFSIISAKSWHVLHCKLLKRFIFFYVDKKSNGHRHKNYSLKYNIIGKCLAIFFS